MIDFLAADLAAVLDSLRGRAVAVDTGTVVLPADGADGRGTATPACASGC